MPDRPYNSDNEDPLNIDEIDRYFKAHEILGCKSISRSDIRYDDSSGNGKFYLMEVNTQPGFTPNSLHCSS